MTVTGWYPDPDDPTQQRFWDARKQEWGVVRREKAVGRKGLGFTGVLLTAVIFVGVPAGVIYILAHTVFATHHNHGSSAPAAAPGTNNPTDFSTYEYTQTWTVSYADTTCDQWLNQMTDNQRFVAGHDFIVALKAVDQSDSFAHTFADDISKDCQPAPQLKVSQVGAGIATLDTTDFPN
jgi:hypothetical protein